MAPQFFAIYDTASAFACALVVPPDWVSTKYKLAIEACNQFKTALTMLVTTWVLFYFLLFLRQINVIDVRWDPWIDLSNNLQGVFLFVAYWILTAKTLSNKGGTEKPDGRSNSWFLWWVYSVLLWLALLFLIADLSASLRAQAAVYTTRILFQLLSGLWVGVALALLTGCMEGQYLGQPRRVTLFLYLYAALQLAYVGFSIPMGAQDQRPSANVAAPTIKAANVPEGTTNARAAIGGNAELAQKGSQSPQSTDTIANAVSSTFFLQEFATVTSLPLKLLFIGFWYWVLQNGLLAFYMKRTRDDIDAVPREWHVFSGGEHKSAAAGTA